MELVIPLLVTAGLLLFPLVPAAVLYLLLTPKEARGNSGAARAKGEIGAGHLSVAGFRLQFNVLGSSATYIVLLAAGTLIFLRLSSDAVATASLTDRQAWLVEVDVKLKTPNNEVVPANNGELQLVRVELEPALTQASANTIQFWVVPNNRRFPSARFNITNLSTGPVVLDLNDENAFDYKHASRRMESVSPVWIEVGPAYGARPR